ncbi:MAG: cysteine hydrolase [Verrucomicrobiota bacterium]|nr:cysteine hydrolase [Verrucomicrobiota bacterium]
MRPRSADLHGSAPDKSPIVLLLIDVINDLDFPEGDRIRPLVLRIIKPLAALKARAKKAGIPAIYVNDNFGRWQSNFQKLVEHCRADDGRGRELVEALRPADDDYFILKPKHSGFFSTALDVLLDYLDAQTLILTGIAGNICVLYTANDAYMRDFGLLVPGDCCVSNSVAENRYALGQMRKFLKADIRPSARIRFPKRLRRKS